MQRRLTLPPAALRGAATLAAIALAVGCSPDGVPTGTGRPSLAAAGPSGAIYTTDKTGTVVNANVQYGLAGDVYLSGGPQNLRAAGLTDGTYYFQVTDPSGKVLLSSDDAACRQLTVSGGRVVGAAGPACKHANGTPNAANGGTSVQLAPFNATPNGGGVYKAWMIPVGAAAVSATDPKVLVFANNSAKTDNFKVPENVTPPPGSCQPSSSLSVLVTGTNVVSYVPKGSWSFGTTGVAAVNVEGTSITNALIPTPDVVNSCASNPITGTTVCTANGTDIYQITGTTLAGTLSSGGSGFIFFSGGHCTNCGIAIDATHDQAVIGLSVGGVPSFQFLKNLSSATPTLEPPFAAGAGQISEDPLIDPIRNRLLSANENGNVYEILDIANTLAPVSFLNSVAGASGELDSSGEDCTTQIALAPVEFSGPSEVFIADITTPPAVFAAGAWSAPSQVQSLSESFLSAGASGIAVAQGTHTGVVSGEFGGSELTAIVLPSASGGGATPVIGDWVTCSISGFTNGFDPHTVTAYQSPNGGHAMALLANDAANTLAVVDLTNMLDPTLVPRTGGGHGCAAGTLPASVVRFVSVP